MSSGTGSTTRRSASRPAAEVSAGLERLGQTLPYFIYLARLEHPGKNHVRLIEAFESFCAQHPSSPHELLLGGADWHGAEVIHERIAASPCRGRIRALGFVGNDDLPLWYAGAAAMVYPSLFEGFGLPPIEAMASGCPVISSVCGSLGEVVGDAARVVDPLSPADMAEALAELAHDRRRRRGLAGAGLAARGRLFLGQNRAGRLRALRGGGRKMSATPSILEYWGLRERPFEPVTDARFYFQSRAHEEALARLSYLVDEQTMYLGMLTGEIGCGKSMTRQVFAAQIDDARHCLVQFENSYFELRGLPAPHAGGNGLGRSAARLGQPASPSMKPRARGSGNWPRTAGQQLVLIFDEAQDMSPETLVEPETIFQPERRRRRPADHHPHRPARASRTGRAPSRAGSAHQPPLSPAPAGCAGTRRPTCAIASSPPAMPRAIFFERRRAGVALRGQPGRGPGNQPPGQALPGNGARPWARPASAPPTSIPWWRICAATSPCPNSRPAHS